MNPNHYLAVAIDYLFATARVASRRRRRQDARLSSMIDRVVEGPGPPGWPKCRSASSGCPGLSTAALRLRRRGERRRQSSCVATGGVDDRQGRLHPRPAGRRDHRRHRQGPRRALPELTEKYGDPSTSESTCRLRRAEGVLSQADAGPRVTAATLAGEPIVAKLTRAPANDAPIGGLKVSPKTAGSPPAPAAPRTSTRSTPRASSAY
jgi:phosphoglucomutase